MNVFTVCYSCQNLLHSALGLVLVVWTYFRTNTSPSLHLLPFFTSILLLIGQAIRATVLHVVHVWFHVWDHGNHHKCYLKLLGFYIKNFKHFSHVQNFIHIKISTFILWEHSAVSLLKVVVPYSKGKWPNRQWKLRLLCVFGCIPSSLVVTKTWLQ